MAVEPKLSDQGIASLLEIPHPSNAMGERDLAMTAAVVDLVQCLGGPGPRTAGPPPLLIVGTGEDRDRLAAYRALRRQAFVERQGLFERDDGDEHDGAAHTIVLVAVAGPVTGLGPARRAAA